MASNSVTAVRTDPTLPSEAARTNRGDLAIMAVTNTFPVLNRFAPTEPEDASTPGRGDVRLLAGLPRHDQRLRAFRSPTTPTRIPSHG